MVEISVINTSPEHIQILARTLRQADEQEIVAAGFKPHRILWRSYKTSIICRTAFVDGEIAACWGCCGNVFGSVGIPWLLTSPACENVSSLKFARIYKEEVGKMLELFPLLVNVVDARYTKAVRLLEIAGFHLEEPQPFGRYGALFRRFSLRAA